jgi:phage baseplate assembly protein W
MGYTLVTNVSNNALFEDLQPYGIGLNFETSQLFDNVYQNATQAINNLKLLLLTKIGERFGVPTYGSDLLYILFEPNLNDLKDNIKDLIRTPINKWLPGIEVIDIVITTAEDNPDLQHEIEIKIIFSIDDAFVQELNINATATGTVTTTSGVI